MFCLFLLFVTASSSSLQSFRTDLQRMIDRISEYTYPPGMTHAHAEGIEQRDLEYLYELFVQTGQQDSDDFKKVYNEALGNAHRAFNLYKRGFRLKELASEIRRARRSQPTQSIYDSFFAQLSALVPEKPFIPRDLNASPEESLRQLHSFIVNL